MEEVVETVGRVVRVSRGGAGLPPGMGIEFDELKPDDELNIPPDVTVKVVQVTQDKLRVELAGEPGTLDRTALPAALAVELAKRKLGDDGKSKVLTALYVNFHVRASATYRKQARQWLEEAGQDAELLDLFEEQE